MLRPTLNLGILAHVDAGKTTLTERLLHAAGVIDEPGSVDRGSTQTDSLALERRRGITIKSAVVSFEIDDVTVNLIDTPGHPDFIAEVERVLDVLDGAVLVVSAVEGVQPQTRVLWRALRRLRVPTLFFVNKIDRAGADCGRVLRSISERLTPATVAMAPVAAEGSRAAVVSATDEADTGLRTRLVDMLAGLDDALLADYVEDEAGVSAERLGAALAAQTSRAGAHPVFFGSALTGAGVEPLMHGIAELLPALTGAAEGPVSGRVFKIERAAAGDRVAYVRMFSGTVQVRDRLAVGGGGGEKVTAISVFAGGSAVARPAVSAGQIARLSGLRKVRIGDSVGDAARPPLPHQFAPPTLESVAAPVDPHNAAALRAALAQLAEQDPLIDVREAGERAGISVSLYGEVQKEVIQATLADEYGLDVVFRETTPIYVERPLRAGEAVEVLHAPSNPFLATIGLRVEPAPEATGVEFRLRIDTRTIPLYLYKTIEAFTERMDEYVRATLQEGLHGWRVGDCVVTLTRCSYSIPDGPPTRRGPPSTAADFRKLTPLVLMRALERARTVVCEPTLRITLELPTVALGGMVLALGRLGAAVEMPAPRGELTTIEAVVPAARLQELQRQLPGLTGGEGSLESDFAGYRPVSGDPPVRRRTTANPLNLDEYMMHLAGTVRRPESST